MARTRSNGTRASHAAPPRQGAIGWARRNLFSSALNAVLTLLGVWLAARLVYAVVDWAVVRAVFSGVDGSACAAPGTGACWPFVVHKLDAFIYGRYPVQERWRVDLTFVLGAIGLVALMVPAMPAKRWTLAGLLVLYPFAAFVVLTGGWLGLPSVETERWGGLMVTLVVALAGSLAAFPIAIGLALGRRSRLPIVRWTSITYIELVRGVPLITMLFMASVMLPLFLPDGVTFDKLARALVGVALFQGAYLAEVIRGGLQAIPRGQYEAADALGLSYAQKMRLVILPQALRRVLPGIVNSFIALLKDTSLVLIIGVFDLLGIVQQAVSSDAKWFSPATPVTGYVFAGFVFWAMCFGISRFALRLERRLDRDARN